MNKEQMRIIRLKDYYKINVLEFDSEETFYEFINEIISRKNEDIRNRVLYFDIKRNYLKELYG